MNKTETTITADQKVDIALKNFSRAVADLKEMEEDPMLSLIRTEAKAALEEFRSNDNAVRVSNREFISRSLRSLPDDKNEIHSTKSDVKELTAEWVREWHKKKQMGGLSKEDIERESFITSSFSEPVTKAEQPAEAITRDMPVSSSGKRIRRIASLVAAAAVTIVIIFGSLTPSNPAKIFEANYEPFTAITKITRSNASLAPDIFNNAVRDYNSGNYQNAAAGFTRAAESDPSDNSILFYLGLTDLAQGKYTDAAAKLEKAIPHSGEFSKEAVWYCGLAHLKTGDKKGAADCFRKLSSSDGFYGKKSQKILRRLK